MLMGSSVCVCWSHKGVFHSPSRWWVKWYTPPPPHHPNQTTPLSTPQCFPLLPWLSWLQHVTPHTGRSDSRASVTFWVCHELQPRGSDRGMKLAGSVWNMAAVLFAVIYGGSQARHATLLWLHFIPQHRNYCACLTRGRGKYSIMVHGEFCCWVEIKNSLQPTWRPVLIRKMRTVLEHLRRLKCATDSCVCVAGNCVNAVVVMFWMPLF